MRRTRLVSLFAQRIRCIVGTGKDCVEAVAVSCWVVPLDFEDFGQKSLPGSAFDVNNKIQRISDISFDCAIRHFYTALQHTRREARDSLKGRISMDG